ncbi:hypothetical protein DERP_007303 [Dermatophagoides pteronyssinus]|uniref:Uncharacterized protein n=1 Tax=Dermatophagoides pteronyssinus TaxID=6956 RepID=A0ABQ8J433_DERPT|nr:hypothetical protein DERP_007303 [Dermatophagoides pteronyssinus]
MHILISSISSSISSVNVIFNLSSSSIFDFSLFENENDFDKFVDDDCDDGDMTDFIFNRRFKIIRFFRAQHPPPPTFVPSLVFICLLATVPFGSTN